MTISILSNQDNLKSKKHAIIVKLSNILTDLNRQLTDNQKKIVFKNIGNKVNNETPLVNKFRNLC